MDKSWIDLPNRMSREYMDRINQFMEFTNGFDNEFISCPCRKCANREERDEIEVDDMSKADPMIAKLDDIACGLVPKYTSYDAQTKLYPRCKDFSKLSFIVELLHLKALNQWSDTSFDMLLQLLHRVLQSSTKLAESYFQARKLTENLGFTYETLDACPNNCMLFRNENAHLDTFIVCQTSRWKVDEVGYNRQNSSTSVVNRGKRVAAKQVRYFPLKPRLKRLFMSSKISKLMRWHAENSRDDGKLTHPADSPAWKDFDRRNPDFALDCRSVQLGLAADGFSPFRHNLDVMHIEKNVCDNILWTILSVQGKSKDGVIARRDLEEMGLRKPLHLQLRESNKAHMPLAQYTMSKDEKDVFLYVLKGVKVPDGYCSNIAKRVNMKERTLQGLKSHDNHILIQ
ncbi:hypothetical protein AAC387_Pa01g2560 [Persea americana]